MVVIYVASKLAIFFFFNFRVLSLLSLFSGWSTVWYSYVYGLQCISCASFQNGLCDYAF